MDKGSTILDFDYTLFDAAGFRKDLANSLKPFGISQTLYTKTYNQIRYRGDREADYIPTMHLQILSQKTGADPAKMKKAYDKIIQSADKYLYNDSIKFLETLKKKKYTLYLLTFGNPAYHKIKIKSAGVNKYFQKIFYTSKDKFEISGQIPGVDKAIFINDNPDEIVELKKIHPKAQFIQIMRPNGKKFDSKLKNIKIIKKLPDFFAYKLDKSHSSPCQRIIS